MGSPLATSTPIEVTNTMRSELKRLRRQNAVPLDLGVTKRTKYDTAVPPPTPSDEETQLSWPSPVRSPTPPPTVSPLQKGEDEAGCQPIKPSTQPRQNIFYFIHSFLLTYHVCAGYLEGCFILY
ncbi:hypothetical protein HOLleu_30187 [Holothuria leucospilota]|uniref:Uncharacterized protein n=1 Tax=Holothuria leucospilota TaxID=206669 RepID=A0A9Q1BK10_HOLLE|nr:hypothetical protein HOLleu_30187 [Holothuria leucospilota]